MCCGRVNNQIFSLYYLQNGFELAHKKSALPHILIDFYDCLKVLHPNMDIFEKSQDFMKLQTAISFEPHGTTASNVKGFLLA